MKTFCWVMVLVFVLGAGLTAVSCGDDDDDDDNDDTTEDDNATNGNNNVACNVQSMCDWAVDCGFNPTVADCLDDYDAFADDCADSAGDLSCECACMNQYADCSAAGDCAAECVQTYC
ncbi:MAG: hypothetical protein GX444_06820 [Myxococcales bacterium]|nr:hypothetical protein [Myxococcales bacterium]